MPNKDFMGMAQGAGASQEPTEQELQQFQMTDADFQEAGLPGGEGTEGMKQRILTMLEEMGAMEGLEAAEQQEIIGMVDQLIKDIEAGNYEAVEENPVMQLLAGAFEGMGIGAEGASPAAPADMAGMAGPGGMPGGGGGMPPMPGGGM